MVEGHEGPSRFALVGITRFAPLGVLRFARVNTAFSSTAW